MGWETLIKMGLDMAGNLVDDAAEPKNVDGKAVADKIDTDTAGGVVGDLLESLVARTDNNIDDALLSLVRGSINLENIDDLIIGYIEAAAAKTNNKVDDHVVAIIKNYLNCTCGDKE